MYGGLEDQWIPDSDRRYISKVCRGTRAEFHAGANQVDALIASGAVETKAVLAVRTLTIVRLVDLHIYDDHQEWRRLETGELDVPDLPKLPTGVLREAGDEDEGPWHTKAADGQRAGSQTPSEQLPPS